MAWRQGCKRAGSAEGLDFRVSPQDRIGGPPKARGGSRRHDGPPARTKGKPRRGKRTKGRSRFGRLIYWSAVLALWAIICVIGIMVWIGVHLPPIQSLEIPK